MRATLGVLAAGLVAVVLAGCGGPADVVRQKALGQSPATKVPCPKGHPLPGNEHRIVDWIDFLQYAGRQYIHGIDEAAHPKPVQRSGLGRVVLRVRCSLTEIDSHYLVQAPFADGTAAYLPKGTEVHAVRGYPETCRLAATDQTGTLRVYIAHHDLAGKSAPDPCGL